MSVKWKSVVNVSVVIQVVAYATPFKGDLPSINRYSLFKSLGKLPSFRLQHPLPELPSLPCHSKSPSGSMAIFSRSIPICAQGNLTATLNPQRLSSSRFSRIILPTPVVSGMRFDKEDPVPIKLQSPLNNKVPSITINSCTVQEYCGTSADF